MKRIDCLKVMADVAGDALVVTGAGGNTVEWNACRPSDGNFRVRTMGLVSSIALGLSLALPERKVIALDGDGSLLMNLSSLPTIARKSPPNLVHVVLDNQVYESSGEIRTASDAGSDLVGIAKAAGIRKALWARSVEEFGKTISDAIRGQETTFIGAKVELGRAEVPPYPFDEVENKYRFIRYVEKTEKIEILKTKLPASFSRG